MSVSIKNIIEEMVAVFEPLTQAVEPKNLPSGIYIFLHKAGVINDFGDISTKITQLANNIKEIAIAITSISNALKNDTFLSPSSLAAFSKIVSTVKSIDDLGEISNGSIKIEQAGGKILSYLIARHTAIKRPALNDFLQFTGALKVIETNDGQFDHFDIDPLFQLIGDPAKWFKNTYGWGSNKLDTDLLLIRLKLLLEKLVTLPYFVSVPSVASTTSGFLNVNLFIPLFHEEQNGKNIESGIKIGPALLPGDTLPKGLRISIYGFGNTSDSFSNKDFRVGYSLSANAQGLFLDLFPNKVDVSAGSTSLQFNVSGEKLPKNNTAQVLLGEANGTRLEIQTLGFELGGMVGKKTDFSLALLTKGGKFVIAAGDGDGFLQKLIPKGGINIDFDPSIGWSYLDGISFGLNAGLEITIPIHRSIGPAKIEDLSLRLGINKKTITFAVTTSFAAGLGPIQTALSGLGLQMDAKLQKGGNLGFLDARGPKFISPKRIGVSLDANIISGGGFLEVDPDKGRYSGALSLDLQGIKVGAIAIILTKLPNGKKGFSMLISISAIFNPPFQLSFGFTLAGVGGLVGVNRTTRIDTLRERIAAGAVNSVMFPDNPIENSNRIISDLEAIFPAQESHFVIAPFLRFGFGTPSIIELDLGVVLEFPFKGRIILLGSLGVYLPVKGFAIVELHIDVIGDFNFAESYIRIEGRLRNSHILSIPLEGGFAFMLDWGSRPAFLFSIGGFHPRYKKPAQFPDVPRLSASINLADVVKLSGAYYQAITSNSFQIGYDTYMEVDAKVASLEAHFGFNALLQFNPFYFSIDQIMSVKVKVMGQTFASIECFFQLSGPSPWSASGYAEVSVLFLSLEIPFHIEWGESSNEPKEYESIAELLTRAKASLETPSNWRAGLPQGFRSGESLRQVEGDDAAGLVLHPSGYLEVRQTALPLNRQIDKYGNSYVSESPVFSFGEDIEIGGKKANTRNFNWVKENFARGQYEDLSEADKLSSPDFEQMAAGLSFGDGISGGFDLGDGMEFVAAEAFEEIIMQPNQEPLRNNGQLTVSPATQQRILLKSMRAESNQLHSNNKYKFVDETPDVLVTDSYQVVRVNDMTPLMNNGVNLQFETYGAAKQFLKHQLNNNLDAFQVMTTAALETI